MHLKARLMDKAETDDNDFVLSSVGFSTIYLGVR